MKGGRFTAGLLLGSSAGAIAYAAGAPHLLPLLIGLAVAGLIWFGEWILDDLL